MKESAMPDLTEVVHLEDPDASVWAVGDEDLDGSDPLFDGDTGQLAMEVRRTFVFLLKKRYISSERHPDDWRVVLENQQLLESRFNDLFLHLVVDRHYQVAYKKQALPEGGVFPTVLFDTAYSREQTILLVYLRGIFRSTMASGDESVFVDRSDLFEEIANYRPANTTNHVRDEKGARIAIDALCTSDILLKTSEFDRYRVSPIIEVLLPVHRVQELIEWLMARSGVPDEPSDLDEEAGLA
jgi:hypothetical protein